MQGNRNVRWIKLINEIEMDTKQNEVQCMLHILWQYEKQAWNDTPEFEVEPLIGKLELQSVKNI